MSPFVLPIVLIVYGEFSDSVSVRHMSRWLLYLYVFSSLLTIYLPSYNSAILTSISVSVAGILYLISITEDKYVSWILVVFFLIDMINKFSLLLNDFSLISSIPCYMEYSGYIYRSLVVAAITTLSYQETEKGHDYKLEVFSVLLCIVEVL